jgi:DNA replication initiation complex subunit (GINS family)
MRSKFHINLSLTTQPLHFPLTLVFNKCECFNWGGGGFENLNLTAEEWALYFKTLNLTAEEWELYFKTLKLTAKERELYFKILNFTAEEWALYFKN